MQFSSKSSIKLHEGRAETAVAIDLDKNSQSAVKWAVDRLLRKNPNCVLIHVKTQGDAESTPERGRPPTEAEAKRFFVPFRGFCARKGISAKELIVGGVDVPTALVNYVTANSISHLVVGASTRNSLLRKFSTSDIGKSLLKSAPETCSIYIVAKDKLQTVRHAKKVPQSPPAAACASTSESGAGQPPVRIITPDTFNVTSSSSIRSSTGWDGSFSRESSDFVSYSSMKPPDSYVSKNSLASSSSGIGDFSAPPSFHLADMSRIAAPLISGQSLASFCPHGNMEDELARLQLELKQSWSVYNMACQDAATAEQKARELRRMKIPQLRSSEEDRRPRKDSWSDMEKMKQRNSLMMVPITEEEELEGQRRNSATAEQTRKPDPLLRINLCYRRYTVEQIEEATEYFSDSRKIGEGGCGLVFKATLDHTPVAIKVLGPDASQGLRQFHQEVEVLSCMRHPNMVILVGACPEYGCLVYEYMDNGNLEDRLFCKGGTLPIPWQTRFKIAAEIAMGLAFLHQAKPEPVVHRDIKPSNILLDTNNVSKISDVGLARLVPVSVADKMTKYHMTAAAGTFCYIDPEYQQTGILGVKSDVYAFGVMLLQIITAKPPMGLARQVKEAIESRAFPMILDQRVTDWPVGETLSLAKLGLKCCELRRKDRPDLASDVLPELIRLKNLGLESMVNPTTLQKQEPEEIEMGKSRSSA